MRDSELVSLEEPEACATPVSVQASTPFPPRRTHGMESGGPLWKALGRLSVVCLVLGIVKHISGTTLVPFPWTCGLA